MIDMGMLLTGSVVIACFLFGRDRWLCNTLMASWAVSALMLGQHKDVTVLVMATLDLAIAGVALAKVTSDPGRYDAQTVGGLSMALMPAHFIMSASLGNVNWTLYAAACNFVFVLQCLTAGGWLDGVGRGIAGFFARFRAVHPVRKRWH